MDREELIALSEAAVISGLSLKHLGLLARDGKLRAKKIGRNWVTTRKAVTEYLRGGCDMAGGGGSGGGSGGSRRKPGR